MKKIVLMLILALVCGANMPCFGSNVAKPNMNALNEADAYPVVTYDGYTQQEFDALEKTTVIRSSDSPTGYFVTFRYTNDEAKTVSIYGEWVFSSIARASVYGGENKGPEDWKDGDTVWKGSTYDAQTGRHNGNPWPTKPMEKNSNGIWVYTIPLPAGTWAYRFLVDGVATANQVADPNSVNYLHPDDKSPVTGGRALTAVFVPHDPVKQAKTPPRYEEMPRQDDKTGTVKFGTIDLGEGQTSFYGLYLPFEFNPNRAEPYPVMVLYHGGGDYYGSWFTNGIINILDNMIAEGRLKPVIVVTPTNDLSGQGGWNRQLILKNVVEKLLPHLEKNYNASSRLVDRAFAGLSMGGATTGYAMYHHADDFGHFILLSPPVTEDMNVDYSNIDPKLKDRTCYIGIGEYDFCLVLSLYFQLSDSSQRPVLMDTRYPVYGSILEFIHTLERSGVPVLSQTLPYGHDWVLWRILMVDVFDNILPWQGNL